MATYQGKTVPAKTVVLSKEGAELFSVDIDGFFHLVKMGVAKIHGNNKKIHRLQLTIEPAQAAIDNSLFDPTFGRKYTKEEHVAGRYYIHQLKPIPAKLKNVFTAVRDSIVATG